MTSNPKPNLRRPVVPGSSLLHTANPPEPRSIAGPAGQPLADDGRPMNAAGVSRPASKRLHRKRAAEYIGASLSWLDKSRLKGDGPVYLQIGGRVIYDTGDLDDYLARCRRRSTSDAP